MGVYVRSHQFCCCLPVRLGVFLMSIITFIVSMVLVVAGGILLRQTTGKSGAAWVAVLLYGALAIVSLFGFVGSISRKVTLIAVYNIAGWVLLAINFVGTCIALYQGITEINQLEDGAVNPTAVKAVFAIIMIMIWLLEFYACHIVNSYVAQLREEGLGYGDVTPWPVNEERKAILLA